VLSATEIANICAAQPPATPPAYTADTGNPSGDGFPNLMKYALGLNPTARISGSLGLPQFSMNGSTFEYSFTRLRDTADITYRVESSTDLSSWSEAWSSASDSYSGTGPSVTEVLQMQPGTVPKEFFRLRVTRP